jgi:hypothetical protein
LIGTQLREKDETYKTKLREEDKAFKTRLREKDEAFEAQLREKDGTHKMVFEAHRWEVEVILAQLGERTNG